MTVVAGSKAHLTLITTDVSAFLTAIHMSLKGHGLVDITAMGATGYKWASDELLADSFTVDFLFDSGQSSLWDILEVLRLATTAQICVIGPYGTTAGYVKISGNVWMEDLPMEVTLGDMIRLTGVPFKFHDGATLGVF